MKRVHIHWTASALAILAMLLPACDLLSSSPPPPGLVRTLSGHYFWVKDVVWSSDGKYLASAASDKSARIWDAATGNTVKLLTGFGGDVSDVAWSPDGKYLATGSAEPQYTLRVWEAANWQVVHAWNPDPSKLVTSLSWSHDSKSLAIGLEPDNNDAWIDVWDIDTKQNKSRLIKPGGAGSVTWSPDDKHLAFVSLLASAALRGAIVIWDTSKGDGQSTEENTASLIDAHPKDPIYDLYSVAWSPDGKRLVTGDTDGSVKIWDMATRQNTATFNGHSMPVESVSWSPDGKRVASGSTDFTTKVWDVTTGQNIATFTHPDSVKSVAWSPDSKLLATGCLDSNVRLWEVK